MCIFPVRFDGAEELKYVFPSKQKAVQKAIELAAANDRIERLIVFGSAVTLKCGTVSDIDIALDVPTVDREGFIKLTRPFFTDIPSEVDIVHYNTVHSKLLKSEIDKGVCVYARQH